MFTGVPASQELIENAKTLTSRGEDCCDDFFTRFVDFDKQSGNTKEYFDSIPNQPLLTFKDKVKKGQSTSIPEEEGKSFAELLTRYDKITLDLEYLLVAHYHTTTRPLCNELEKRE